MHSIPVSKTEEKPKRLSESITNTKKAAVLATLGIPFEEKSGIYIRYDDENPRKSGGVAHFHFKPEAAEDIRRLLGKYDDEKSDIEFDDICREFIENGSREVKEAVLVIRQAYTDALPVWGRRIIENYIRLVQFLKSDAPEFVVTGGEPCYDDEGGLVGKQGFQIRFVPRKKANGSAN
jgi:hypothetical protein